MKPILVEIVERMPEIFNTYQVIAEYNSNYEEDYQSIVKKSKGEQGANNRIGGMLSRLSKSKVIKIKPIGNVRAIGLNGKPGNPMQWKKLK